MNVKKASPWDGVNFTPNSFAHAVIRAPSYSHFVVPKKPQKRAKRRSSSTCTVCGKVYSHPGDLSRHMRVHTGWRRYQCDMCEKAFFRSDHLSLHKKHRHA